MFGSAWRDWWWVVAFCFLATFTYIHFIEVKKSQIKQLSLHLDSINEEKLEAFSERDLLRLQIQSQNDPSWIEMILMRDLGVVPEGWLKVHFAK